MKKIYLLFLAVFSVSAVFAQPANDDACSPTMLTIGDDCSGTLPYTNVGATAQLGEKNGECYGDGSAEQTVWFAFVAPASGAVSVDTDFPNSFGEIADNSEDNQLAVFELQGGDCTVLANFIEIACNEDKLPVPENTFMGGIPPFPVTAGTTYYIQVDGFANADEVASQGAFCIVVTEENPPTNDDCANADVYGGFGPMCTKIWGDTEDENASTVDATAGNGIDVFSCDGGPFNASVYYSFIAGVAEVEFNLLSGENINVSLLTESETCDAGGSNGSIEVSGNCFTGINTSAMPDPMDPDVLFTNLTPMTSYLMAIWTDEGEETEFSFCLTRAPAYECGDGVCYALAESYTDCAQDCPCESSIDFFNYATGEDSDAPYAVCPEIVNGTTDEANPGLYLPFSITTLDGDLTGSLVSTTAGTLFTSTTPPSPLPDNEATNFLKYLFLTEAEIAAGGSITISFTSDENACSADLTFSMADLVANSPAAGDCGGCDLIVTADYSNLMCDGNGNIPTPVSVQNGVGPNIWFGLDGNTTFDPDDDNFPLSLTEPTSIPFGDSDGTFTIYDSGKPNWATRVTFYTGDYNCTPSAECAVEGGISTNCRLDSEVSVSSASITCNEDGTLNIPIDIGRSTGTVTFNPDVATGSGSDEDPFTVTVDPNNCETLNFSVSDESDCGITPIVTINSPASLAGGVDVGTNGADWGLQIATELGICGTDTSVVGTLAVLNDGNTAGGQLTDFCEPDPTNPMDPPPSADVCAPIVGKIAMIDRGQCNFTSKIENAQACGAIGVIICNCQVGPSWCAATADELMTMGAAPDYMGELTIPAVFMLYSKCEEIKAVMDDGIDVQACIGAPETIVGCERDLTLDVCADYSTQACDDGDACTENDVATVDASGAEICACAGTAIVCADGETLNPDSCMCESDCVMPDEPETACYETATFDEAACMWEVTGEQPEMPTGLACYETATFNDATCVWDVTGEQDPEPDTACYETATFDDATCAWVVEGDPPAEPENLECYQTATFNDATCAWDVAGDPPVEPDTACYEKATFNDATCMWDVTGEQDPEPTTACFETATFDDTACEWVVEGVQPDQPTDLACYQEVGAFDDATCEWQILGEPPTIDDGCDLTDDSFDETTCEVINTSTCEDGTTLDEVECVCTTDVIEGCTDDCASNYNPDANSDDGSCMLPEEPTTACYETAAFNDTSCEWEISGEQPEAPATECYETAEFDDASCSWTVSGERDPEPGDLACYETASFDDTSCAWVIEGEQPPTDDGCDLTDDSFDEATCMAVNTPNCPDGASFDADNCVCTDDPIPGCTDDTACNYDSNATEDDGSCTFLPDEPTDLACYEEATANLETCSWDISGEQPPIDDGCDLTTDTFDDATCMAVNTPDCPENTSFNATDCTCDSELMCTDPCAPNFEAGEACEDYSTDCNTDCSMGPFGGSWDAASCSCIDEVTPVSGCTDSAATNYNADANCDDGSCEFDVQECTPPSAGDFNCDE